MQLLTSTKRRAGLLLAAGLLAGCRLTSTDVEPALPGGRVNDSPTLVYRANGLPVVANNSVNIGTILVAAFGFRQPVSAQLAQDSTLVLEATDVDNQPGQRPFRILRLELPHFRGAGTYQLLPTGRYNGTYFQVVSYDSLGHASNHAEQQLVASPANQVVVTGWNPASRVLQGTFTLRVAGPHNPQAPTELNDGRFDLDVR